jgi:hypothetical protein
MTDEEQKRGLHAPVCNHLKVAKCIEINRASDKSCESAAHPSCFKCLRPH